MASRSDKLEEMARVFHSLSHETRLAIMTLLAEGEMNVTTIHNKLKLQQNSTSYHLELLRQGGMVVNRCDGHYVFYSHADLSKHRLGRTPKATLPDVNAARFGPAELVIPRSRRYGISPL